MISAERPQPCILVLDDEQVVLAELTAVLTTSGFVCHCCATAEAAIATAEAMLPDLILADVHLQGANGVEVCHQIQQNPDLADVPVMFLSAGQTPDIIRRSNGNGGTYYIRKPFDSSVLIELIDRALGHERCLVAVLKDE